MNRINENKDLYDSEIANLSFNSENQFYNQKRDYLNLVNSVNPNFGSEGWSDGYNDLPNDAENIVEKLFGKVSNEQLVNCINLYLKGYEVGKDMSENADIIYDEDGNLKEEFEMDSIIDYTDEAIKYIENHRKLSKIKKLVPNNKK